MKTKRSLFLALALFLAQYLPSSLLAQIPAYVPNNGLVGYWPFNGNANDESGNGNHGTVNGATLTVDRFGNAEGAYSFNANYIEVQSSQSLNNSQGSIGFWMKSTNTGLMVPIKKNNYSFAGGEHYSFALNYQHIFSAKYNSNCSPGIGWVQAGGNNSVIQDGNWHFIAATYSDQLKVYIDGTLISSDVAPNSVADNCSSNLQFGREWSNSPNYYFGNLDDIAIYNRALTQEEITALYTGTSSNNNGGGGSGSTAGTPAASVPAGIPYQAVIRDNTGAALVNTPVTVRFTLHENTTSGTAEYQETQSLTTNSLGLINTQFGAGTATQGTFAGINWSNTTKFIQVEANTGAGYVDMGTQQMMSVPFAIKSNEANKVKNAGLPVYADNAAALAGGLVAGEMYRTAAGILMIVY